MTPDLKFSIVVPTYNRAAHIGDALRSLLAQTYANFEVLVIDDGSTDDTELVVQKFTDPRIRYIHQANRERGAARNNGMNNATGDIIGFLDSDDTVLPDHLEKTAQFIHSRPDHDMYCMSYTVKEGGRLRDVHLPEQIGPQLIKGNLLSCNGVFLRKETAGQFRFSEDRALSALEDWELWLRIAATRKVIGSPEVTSVIVQHDARSVMQATPEKIERRFDAFFNHVLFNTDIRERYKSKLRRLRASCETYMALHLAMAKKHRGAALKHLFRGIGAAPGIIFTRRFAAILKHLP